MSSDDLSAANLPSNYTVPWKKHLQRLIGFILSTKGPVEAWDEGDSTDQEQGLHPWPGVLGRKR